MRLKTYKMALSILPKFLTLKWNISRTIWRNEVGDGSFFAFFTLFHLSLIIYNTGQNRFLPKFVKNTGFIWKMFGTLVENHFSRKSITNQTFSRIWKIRGLEFIWETFGIIVWKSFGIHLRVPFRNFGICLEIS